MTRKKTPALVITFDTTAQALAAEELFTLLSLPGRIIPTPAQIKAGCGLAWKAEPSARAALCNALQSAGLTCSTCRILEMF